MTNREFFVSISEGKLTEDCVAHATEALTKMDAANAKRKDKPSKTSLANEPIKAALLTLLTENPNTQYTENELGTALEVTHNKAGSLVRQLVAEGKAVSTEAKFPKVGKRKVYSLAK